MTSVQQYILSFLLAGDLHQWVRYESYEKIESVSDKTKIFIVQSKFFSNGVYGTTNSLPKVPFANLPESDVPFLFGESRLEKDSNGRYILYADIIASAYYMLSRYEEVIKTDNRDQYGRFLAKDSIVFQQGYGFRPLVDEWGLYLRNLLRKAGVEVTEEKHGIQKVFLTHDVDTPFEFYRISQAIKQWIKNIIHRGKKILHPFSVYITGKNDSQNTFKRIIEIDTKLQKKLGSEFVEPIYFLIAAGSACTKNYCNIRTKKFQKLISELSDSGATLGLHVSLEAGDKPELIKLEMKRLLKYCKNSVTKSRHHFLRWTDPEHIEQMEDARITEDFTLGYADSVGFRVGTCRPYYFINPRTKTVSNVLEYPMEIMECSLDRPNYMGLEYERAVEICKRIIDEVYKFNGELVLLFHNPIWDEKTYYGKLYEFILDYISNKKEEIICES